MKGIGRLGTALSLLAGLAACSGGPEYDHPGWEVYRDSGCVRCHTAAMTGGPKGPALKALKSVWSEKDLLLYLKHPAEYIRSSERLQELKKQYPKTMPSIRLSEEDRKNLAAFLLEHT